MHELFDALRVALQKHLNPSVPSVANVPRQAISHRYAVDEGAETNALNNACDAEFNTQRVNLSLNQTRGFLL